MIIYINTSNSMGKRCIECSEICTVGINGPKICINCHDELLKNYTELVKEYINKGNIIEVMNKHKIHNKNLVHKLNKEFYSIR